MLQEVTAEILQLKRDNTFIRNLFLTSLLAIACLCSLSEMQSQNTKATEQVLITTVSNSASTRMIVSHK